MPKLSISSLFTALLAFGPALAKEIGYFDGDTCADPKGLEQCYADAEQVASQCVLEGCEEGGMDCLNLCYCIQTASNIECAGTHCWNQVNPTLSKESSSC